MKIFDTIKKGKFIPLFFCLLFPLLLPGETARIRILQTTDLHGQYSDGKNSISAARLGSVITRLRQEAGESNTLYIDCGDLFQGTLESYCNGKGSHFARLLNLWHCDAFIPGNHDFDFGVPVFIRALQPFRGRILACNLTLQKRGLTVLPWAIFQRGGVKTGVIGLAPRFMDQWFHPRQLEGATFQNSWADLKASFASLMRQKPHIVILAMHQGEYHSERKEPHRRKREQFLSRLFREYPQILLVLGGHTHQISPGKRIYRGQWYVQAPPHAEGVAVIDVQWDKKKNRLLALRSRIVNSAGERPHPPSARHLFPAAGRVSGSGKKVIGYIPEALTPLKRYQHSNKLSRLFCKSMLEATGAEIAFHGTLSNFIFKGGPLRERQIFLLAPYENPLVTIPLTRDETETILQEQYQCFRKGYFQQLYGVERSPRADFPRGRKRPHSPMEAPGVFYCSSPSGKRTLWKKGEKKVAFTAYVLSGAGGRFPLLRKIGEKKAHLVQFHPVTIREAFRSYISIHHPPGKGRDGNLRKGKQ